MRGRERGRLLLFAKASRSFDPRDGKIQKEKTKKERERERGRGKNASM